MKRLIARSLIAVAAAAGISAVAPDSAKADNFHIGTRIERRDDRGPARRWVEPVYEERVTQVWCEPVYETRYEPRWVKPYYKTVCERVWVEPVYEWREVVSRDRRGGRIVRRERVCIREGGWQNVERQEYVPGHTKHEEVRVLVRAGHFENKVERICVREGHWETVAYDHDRRRDDDRGRERFSFSIGLGGIFK